VLKKVMEKEKRAFKSAKVRRIWGSALKYLPELLEELKGVKSDEQSHESILHFTKDKGEYDLIIFYTTDKEDFDHKEIRDELEEHGVEVHFDSGNVIQRVMDMVRS